MRTTPCSWLGGATSLSGGQYGLNNGLTLLNVSNFWQEVTKGAVLCCGRRRSTVHAWLIRRLNLQEEKSCPSASPSA